MTPVAVPTPAPASYFCCCFPFLLELPLLALPDSVGHSICAQFPQWSVLVVDAPSGNETSARPIRALTSTLTAGYAF